VTVSTERDTPSPFGSRTRPGYNPLTDGPFRRDGLYKRAWPFAAVAILAEASLALPPGPKSAGYTALSVIFLVAVLLSVPLAPWARLPSWASVLVPVAYVASVLTLVVATGSATSGIGIVVIVPLVWSVLFHRRWESFVVVFSILVVEVITSLTPMEVSGAVLSRRVVFWASIGLLIALSAHDLRDRARGVLLDRETMLRRTDALAAAAQQLTMIFDSNEVITTATELAAQLVSPPGTPGRRAQYTRLVGSSVTIIAQYDETGQTISDFPLSDHPILQEVMGTGHAINRQIDIEALGPQVRRMITTLGLTHGVYVPVYLDGAIDGVLAVPIRGQSVSADLFEYCKAVGHLTELALTNARNHERLAEQATTDELTGLPNRRAFDHQVVKRPGRLPFCVLALDLDGLKKVNDTEGHTVGDELLIHFSRIMSGTLRHGDVFARLGGDEFGGLIFNADASDGTRAASRMLAALADAPFRGEALGVSIGVASGGPDSNGAAVFADADAAMYRAKRSGGRRYILATGVSGAFPGTAADGNGAGNGNGAVDGNAGAFTVGDGASAVPTEVV
jgi:diguanylate cyclase (GGDEF)-like protein